MNRWFEVLDSNRYEISGSWRPGWQPRIAGRNGEGKVGTRRCDKICVFLLNYIAKYWINV